MIEAGRESLEEFRPASIMCIVLMRKYEERPILLTFCLYMI